MWTRGSRGAYVVALVVAGLLVVFFSVVPGLALLARTIAAIAVIAMAVVTVRYLHGDIEMFPDSWTDGAGPSTDNPTGPEPLVRCWRCGQPTGPAAERCWSCDADLTSPPS
jgi:hypothetical protein